MTRREQCLNQLDAVFDAAQDPSAAYLIRSRLRRTTLSCARMVAASTGTVQPEIPGAFVPPVGATSDQEAILRLCRRIHAIAGDLCQPSESFDVRWEQGWAGLREELARLRQVLADHPPRRHT